LHPPLKGALGVAVFFGSFSSDVRRNERIKDKNLQISNIAQSMKKRNVRSQQEMVKESLKRAFDEFYLGNVHHNARDLFKKW
jgi:hypothetical protein